MYGLKKNIYIIYYYTIYLYYSHRKNNINKKLINISNK